LLFTENHMLLTADISEEGILSGYFYKGSFNKIAFLNYSEEKENLASQIFPLLERALELTANTVRNRYPCVYPFSLSMAVSVFGEIGREGVWNLSFDQKDSFSKHTLDIGAFLKEAYGLQGVLFLNRSCARVMPIALEMGLEETLVSSGSLKDTEFIALRENFLSVLQRKAEQRNDPRKEVFRESVSDAEREATESLCGLYAYYQKNAKNRDGIYSGVLNGNPAISVNTSHSHTFPILRVQSFREALAIVLNELQGKRPLVVLDAELDALYEGSLERSIREVFQNTDCSILKISPSEQSGEKKDTENLEKVIIRAMETDLPRDGVMIGIGGGVILDIVGFAAQQYRRMVSYYRIPTTLVGQIDAGVGIKVGINYKSNKNLLGGFYPPSLVVNCTDFLYSLRQEDFICGISEILKAGIADCPQIVKTFSGSESAFSPRVLREDRKSREKFQTVTELAIQTMLMNLQSNFYEQKELRRLMDFGHTFSPIFEGVTDYRIPHGFAVAIDMFICIYISKCLRLISDEVFFLYRRFFLEYGLLRCFSFIQTDFRKIFEDSVRKTVLHRAGNLNLVLPIGYGRSGFLNLEECKCTDSDDYIFVMKKEKLRDLFDRAVLYIKGLMNGGSDENLCL